MADNFVRGYQFDGATGLKTGANLEDLVTLATFAAGAADAGNTTRLFDASTLDLDGNNRARIADAGVGVDQIAAAIAGTGLNGGAGSALSVDATDMDGDGLAGSGSVLSVDHDGEGLTISGGKLALELNGATLSKGASGLKVADGEIGATQLTDASITAAKLDTIDCFLVDKGGSDQSFTSGATDLVWDTASPVINVGAGTFPTTARYIPGIAGIWEFTVFVTHYSIATNVNVHVEIRKNPYLVAQGVGDVVASPVNSERGLTVKTYINMNGTTDYVKAVINTTGNGTIFGDEYLSQFMGKFIGQAS